MDNPPLMGIRPAYYARQILILTLLVSLEAWGRGGGGCFLPNTPILRADGSSEAIQLIEPGDTVLAYESNGHLVSTKVHALLQHPADHYYTVVTSTQALQVTGEHPFFVGKGTFKTVESLHRGDVIYVLDKNQIKPEPILSIARIQQNVTVYNLQTDNPHTYFASSIAVHNKGGGCFPAGTLISVPEGMKPIEQLAPHDKVIAINRNGGKFVSHIQSVHVARSPVLVIETSEGTLRTTAEHPVAQKPGKFVEAGRLSVKDTILFEHKNHYIAATIQSIHTTPDEKVFNLQVTSPHTFIADHFLVHNKGGGGHLWHGGNIEDESIGSLIFDVFSLFVMLLFVYGFIRYHLYALFLSLRNGTSFETEFYKMIPSTESRLDFIYTREMIALKADKTIKLLTFISRQDTGMAPDALKERVSSVFETLQDCWSKRDYTLMKPLMMPDLFEQHLRQIKGMVLNHEINRIDNLRIETIDLVNVRYTDNKEQREFTALVTATATDYYIDDRNNQFIRGDKNPSSFQEFWTFQFHLGEWLLREIEQAKESGYLKTENFFEQFTDQQIQKIYGDAVDRLGAAGPGLTKTLDAKQARVERMLNFLVMNDWLWDRQAMLARVRQVFSSLHLALEAGALTSEVKNQLFPEVAEAFQKNIDDWKAAGNAIEYRNFCIRKVEIVLVRNFDDKTKNEFVARISAHAQRIRTCNGIVVSKDEDVTPFEEFWTFGCLDKQWKLKEAQQPEIDPIKMENIDETTSPDMVKWYYTKKRAF